MKYFSAVILVVLLSWTWCLATSERTMKLEDHRNVEDGVENDVRGFIQKRFPGVKEIFCNRLYTELVNPGTDLIAHFRCHAIGATGQDDTAEQVFEGFLRLKSIDGFQTWAETGGEIDAREVRFLNGFKITPEAETSGSKPDESENDRPESRTGNHQ